jgi:hypothetical protein
VIALLGLGVVVTVTTVPGVFIVDEINYLVNVLALRDGRVTIANTDGLPPSRELVFFDPFPPTRIVDTTPVASTAPPLYAPIALPFSWFGWRGLVAINLASYLATTALLFAYSRRYSSEASTPWLAAAAFALGGYAIEYAQGLWPQALSFALCTGGIVAASRLFDGGRPWWGAAAGLLLATATGIRYQNAVLLAAAGAGIGLWAHSRWKGLLAFGLAAAIPLAASSAINHARLDSWNPISKGKGYINVPLLQDEQSSALDPLVMGWAQVVDASARPPLVGPDFASWVRYDEATGAHLMLNTTVKKAFLQSAPWAALAFLMAALAWTRFQMPDAQRRQMRFLSLAIGIILAMFALAGVRRHDGLAFNQRYLLELLPLAAVGFAWAIDGLRLRSGPLMAGASIAAIGLALILASAPAIGGPEIPRWTMRIALILKVPLLLAASLVACWILARIGYQARTLIGVAAGLCLGWGLTLHLADDTYAANRLRRENLARTQALAGVLTDRSALVAWWGHRDAAGPLLFDRDIVILDAWADQGEDAPRLIRELLAQGRKVVLLEDGIPASVAALVTDGLEVRALNDRGLRLVELR